MKFQSRKDAFFIIVTFSIIALLIWVLSEIIPGDLGWIDLSLAVIILLLVVFIVWMYFDTSYILNEKELSYKSGPLRGKIEINLITEVVKDKTLWVGLKPATARNGLIIRYKKYNEIYISPKTNDLFIAKLLEFNSEVNIVE